MKNLFSEARVIFFAPECGGEKGYCLPKDNNDVPKDSERVDNRIEDATMKLTEKVAAVGSKLDLKVKSFTNSSGNLEFSFADSLDRPKFSLELDADSGEVLVTSIPLPGRVGEQTVESNYATLAGALGSLPETEFGRNQQLSLLAKKTGLGVEVQLSENGGRLSLFTDRKSGDRVFTVWSNAGATQWVLVKNTPSGGTKGKPYRSDRLDTLLSENLDKVWTSPGKDDGPRVATR